MLWTMGHNSWHLMIFEHNQAVISRHNSDVVLSIKAHGTFGGGGAMTGSWQFCRVEVAAVRSFIAIVISSSTCGLLSSSSRISFKCASLSKQRKWRLNSVHYYISLFYQQANSNHKLITASMGHNSWHLMIFEHNQAVISRHNSDVVLSIKAHGTFGGGGAMTGSWQFCRVEVAAVRSFIAIVISSSTCGLLSSSSRISFKCASLSKQRKWRLNSVHYYISLFYQQANSNHKLITASPFLR